MGLELSIVIIISMMLIAFYIVLGITAVFGLTKDLSKKTLRNRLIKAAILLFWPAAVFIAVMVGAYRTIVD